MLTLLIVLPILLMLLFAAKPAYKQINSSKQRKALVASTAGMSAASKQIYNAYNKLPAESRTYGDIANVLRALDVKHGVAKVNTHFQDDYSTRFNWSHSCNRYSYDKRRCPMSEYTQINESISDIVKARAEQKHAMQVAAIAGDLNEVEQVIARLREERNLLMSVTKELL